MDNNIGNQMMHIRSGTGTMSMWTIFMHADRVDVWLMVFGTIGAMCDGLILPLVIFLLSQVFNNVGRISGDLSNQRSSFTDSITQSALLFCYVGTGAWVVCFLEGYCWTRTGARQAAKMRVKYLKAVLRQDVEYFDLHHTGTSELINTVSTDSLVIQDCITEKIPNFIMNVTTFIGGYIAAFSMLWRLAIVSFPFVILLVIPGLLYGRILMDLARKMTQEYNKAGAIVEQAISSIRTVYAFVGENKTISDFSLTLKGTVDLGLKQGLAKGLAIGSNGVIYVVWAFNAWYGSRLVMYHNAQGGTVFAVGAALGSGGIALGSSLANIKYISEAATAADRIIQLINRVPKIDSDNTSGQTMDSVTGEIEFRNVEFAYPSRPDSIILHNFSLTVPARKMVALVGASGSGKSTLVSLLQRYYDPLGGQIFLDAIPINKLQLKWLRSKMGLVSQEPSLFAISIKENILFGKEDATMEEVVQAAKTSNAHNFIMELPQGYDTQVGERGVQLSGGQKQRVAIARAIVRKPPILLLDEATSGMDYESERVVQESIYKVGAGCTSIVIAHRLSTIIHADNIVIIQNGQVMESGSHDKLVCINDGLYSSMIRLRYEDYNKHQPSNPSTLSNSNSDRIDNTNCQNLSAASFSRCTTSPMSFHGLTNEKIHSIQKKTKPSEYPVPSFGRLLALNLQEWKQGAIGCLSATLFGIVHPLYAYMLGSLISIYFLPSHDEIKMKVVVYSVLFLGLFVFSMAVNVSQHYNFSYIGECLTKRIREMLLSKILTFEMGWFDQDENSIGSICSRLAIDAGLVRLLVGDRMALLVQTISATSTAIVMGLVIAWRLTIVLIAIQPLIIVCFYTRRVLLKNMSKKAIKTQHRSSKLAVDAVSNIRLISSFSSQSRILRMLENCEKGLQKESIRQSWYAGIGLGTAQSLIRFTWALYFWYGGNLIAQGYVDAKQLFQTFLIFMGTSRLIADAGSMTSDLAKGADAVHSVFTILDSATQIEPNDPKGYKLDKIIGHVEFNDVDFVYPSRPNAVVFKGFSLSIQAGKSTALVGHSGSGKSTIFALIERFYNPLRGSITVEGRYIQSYNLKSLRKNIALVCQEPTLFATTIRENIAYGLSDNDTGFDESEIVEAAKVANAHDFISGLKDGYETRCGDKGIQLSGGQKQRIAIARAIIRSPSMLLLDEATSALDNQSEKVIQDTIEQIMIGRTSVIVAHRLSTIRDCHSIVVLDKGKVVEKGTHSSLLSKEGPYYSLVCLQRNHNT